MNWYERYGAWNEHNRDRLDLAIAGVLVLIGVPLSVAAGQGGLWFFGFDTIGAWSGVFAFLLLAPLGLRHRYPIPVVATVYTVALLHMLLGPPIPLVAAFAVPAVLYNTAAHGPVWGHRLALFSAFAGAALFGLLATDGPQRIAATFVAFFTLCLLFVAVWALGLMRRARIAQLRALRDRNRALESEQDRQKELGAVAERTRIAREMHDIVAHSLSVMIAQADGGRYAAASNPAVAKDALDTIAETGRAALADMRRLLGVLRQDDGGSGTPTLGELAPQPAGDNLETLINQIRASGVRVSLVRVGSPRNLPPGAGLTLYRVCQEALTNILKHAGPDPTVTIVLTWSSAAVTLEVEDDGRGVSASDGQGMGLLGMRERAGLFGGTVRTGPRPGGGFRVHLVLPLPEAA
ncbi:sensor histidine kinase [Jonesia quinghaiensis]|uniref:sensor histidine kinase n=1 Tax=Jonesia quinghaiensis TaxID=262806 RepID=UPI0003F850FB|nr:sensor histidine kinase [Jonesia quinghaiensis]